MKFIILFFILLLPLLAEVGKVTFIKGDVSVQRSGKSQSIKVGYKLHEKDLVVTKKDSLVKLLFADKTSISVGSKSDFSIEEYFFDETKNSVAKFKMKSGVFRAITGRIAKVAPNKFKLKTKTATMGIRGTIFSGIVGAEKEEFFCEKGAIYVVSGGVSVDVAKGFSTSVVQGRKPTAPKAYKPKQIEKIGKQTGAWKGKECKK